MTKQLAQYSVPAENSRVIRVFLSSTFRDMEMERSALVKLFKGLQVKAASRGATISLVDLRWGITEEDAKSGKVVEICLKEIVNSRPFFIGMVGDRYGWCPSYEDLSQTLNDSLGYRWIEDDLNHHLSVTEIEMQFGVLRNPNPLHAYFYIKQSADDELSCPEEESLKLKRLKESILQQDRYPVQVYDSPEQLCDFVGRAFTRLIEREFPEILTVEDNQELQEQLARNELLFNYHSISEADQAFADFLAADEQRCLVVTGDCGLGKSALLAHWSDLVNNDMPIIPIYHRLDSTALSSYPATLVRMLASKCQNAFKHQSLGEEKLFAAEVSKEPDSSQSSAKSIMDIVQNSIALGNNILGAFSGNTLRNLKEIEEDLNSIQKFAQLWSVLGASRYPVILLIDDISYLNPTEVSLFSLFASIPSNVKVVLSFSASSTAYLPFIQNGYVHFQLNGFSQVDAKEFSKQYLSAYSKTLSAQQEDILGSWVLAKQPRCLSVLLNELVSFGQYDALYEYMSGYCRLNEVEQFYDSVLRRLSADYGFEEIGRTLLMLSLTLEGFTEDEVKSMAGINQMLWSQLKVEMSSWLTNKGGRYCICDTQMVEAIKRCFAQGDMCIDKCRHKIITSLLDNEDILSHQLTFADYSYRMKQFCYHDSYRYKVEITYQGYKMQERNFLRKWICDVELFEILYRTNYSLLEDCWKALMSDDSSFMPDVYAESDFGQVDSFLIPVIANDIATFLSRSFHLTKVANVVSEKCMEGAAIPPIARSVLKMNEGCRYARDEEYEMACDCFLKALMMQENIVPIPVPQITDTCRNLGMACYYNGQYNEAVTYLNRALGYHAASTDENNMAEIIELYELLAYCDYYKKNEESAAEQFRKVAKMHESLNGRLSSGVAKCMRMQGRCLYCVKQYDEAWNLMNRALDIAMQIDNRKQIVACHKQLYYLCIEFKRIMNERNDEQAATLFFHESLLHEVFFSEKPRLAELTIRYEALRCDIMQQYYMNKDYDNVIRIATSLDIHDDGDPDSSCLVYYYKALAYTKKKDYPMAKAAFFKEFELRKKHQGWENEDTIVACQNLGVLHKYCYERKDALACFREAYGHEVKRNGEDSELARTLLQYISFVK